MSAQHPKLLIRLRFSAAALLLALSLIPAAYLTAPVQAYAGETLVDRSLFVQNNTPGATSLYTVTFTISEPSTLGSIEMLFCSNSPLQDDSCTTPVGMDVTQAHVKGATGISNFTMFPVTTNELMLNWTPTPISFTPPHVLSFTFTNIKNPNTAGSYYLRLSTYQSTNITGPTVNFGGLAFAITSQLQISSVVPPYLTFCAAVTFPSFDCATGTGNFINFGELSSDRSSQGSSQLFVSTNASSGDTIQMYGTTMTSGNNVISALTSAGQSQPGSAQFGLNLRANTVPSIGADPVGPGSGQPASGYDTPNQYKFVSNDTIANAPVADERLYTVSYLVNIPKGQAPGIYASTLTYVCSGSF